MLFDLRARGRRRAVKVIYVGLVAIFLLGFVGAGVGGGFGSGGVFDIFTGNEGSGSASFAREVAKYRKLTQKEPGNAAAWEKLISVQLHEGGGEAYVSRGGGVTSKGKELFTQIAQSWNSYLALNPPKPNAELAQRMVVVLGEEGLSQPAAAVQALQIVVAAKPNSAALYASLAEYAYKAHNVRVGDLASSKAISLAPAVQRPRLKNELAEAKKNPSGEKVYTTTTNGKTYTGKLNSKGELQATEVKTTTAPAGKSSTGKK
jgi:hypothetical protein